MVYKNNFSDYGSGNSSRDSSMSFGGLERWSPQQPHPAQVKPLPRKASSFVDLVMGRCTLEDVMQEFRMNGSDSPYTPDEEKLWSHRADELIGMGPSGTYLRQKSWPEPERTPATKLPRPASEWLPSCSTPIIPSEVMKPEAQLPEAITDEQFRVLSTLPSNVLHSLLRQLEQGRAEPQPLKPKRHPEECRFCKNNGERASYYRSHALKDALGRVACPVLRAFVCRRCGASGDSAHTLKYCPLSTNEERIKSAAMMRSVRMASGRRRSQPTYDYVMFGDAPTDLARDAPRPSHAAPGLGRGSAPLDIDAAPLDPLWAALEQKLML